MVMLKSLLGVSKEPSNGVGDNGKKGLNKLMKSMNFPCRMEKDVPDLVLPRICAGSLIFRDLGELIDSGSS